MSRRAVVAGAVAGAALGGTIGIRRFYAGLEAGTTHNELVVARTGDGWNLGVHAYRPEGDRRPAAVVCSHGFAGSRLIFDLGPEVSLARYLARQGWPTYTVDLRGRNNSWPDGGPVPDLQWTFDDFLRSDLPAVVAAACDHAQVDRALWVGLEMSGQLWYAAAISEVAPQLSAGVTIGAPAVTGSEARVPGVTAAPRTRRGGRIPFRAGAAAAGPLLALLHAPALESSFRMSHTDPSVAARYLRHGVPDEATALADQFTDWVEHATMRSGDGSVVWSDRLDQVRRPTLVIAGERDLQRPRSDVEATYRSLGATDKELAVAGRRHGFSVDYGHDDLLGGRPAPDEIYPRIHRWFTAHT